MNIHRNKEAGTRSTSPANGSPKRQGKSSATAQLADNRPKAAVLLKMQEPANHSPQISQLRSLQELADSSPQVSQLRSLQELAESSPQVSRLRALQQLANNSPQVSQLRSLQQLAMNSPQAKQAAQFQALSEATAPWPTQQQFANGIAQRAQEITEDDELIQAKPKTAQRQPNELDSKPRPNNTGLPDNLKSGIEALSGLSLDNVRVYYNSAQPAQLNALATAQGSDIHLAPGQEQHLPHEAWHVVQQAQGRVRPTLQLKDGVPVNDDAGLEREADVMGGKAMQTQAIQRAVQQDGCSLNATTSTHGKRRQVMAANTTTPPIQCMLKIDRTLYNSFEKYEKNTDVYDNVLAWLKTQDRSIDKKGYDSTLKQYVSSEHVNQFHSLDHFKQNLLYDLRQGTWTKDSNASATIRYTTRRGWQNAALKKGSIDDKHEGESISLYRTMPLAEAKAIMITKDISKLGGHLGDYAAALNYCHRATDHRVLVEFQLNPGSHLKLFSSENMAISPGGITTTHIRERYETANSVFEKASKNEGTHEKKVGVKSEIHGVAGFSLSAHGNVASVVLKPMISMCSEAGTAQGELQPC
jgi:hypothetical protein